MRTRAKPENAPVRRWWWELWEITLAELDAILAAEFAGGYLDTIDGSPSRGTRTG